MGNTFPPLKRGGVYAVEGVFGDGPAPALCGEAARRGVNERCLPRVRHLSQDWLQDLPSVQGKRFRSAKRSLSTAGALRQPVAAAAREPDCHVQAREAPL